MNMFSTKREEELHHRAVTAEKKLERFEAENGIDIFKARCNAEIDEVGAKLERSRQREANLREKVHVKDVQIRNLKTENKELHRACQEKDKEISRLSKENEDLKSDLDEEKEKLSNKNKECEELTAELNETKDKLEHKKVILNHDHTNSSKPSGEKPYHKKLITESIIVVSMYGINTAYKATKTGEPESSPSHLPASSTASAYSLSLKRPY